MPWNTSLLVWTNALSISSGNAVSAVSTFAGSPGRWKHWICVKYHHAPNSAAYQRVRASHCPTHPL
jgi:hypothetical protein